MSSRDAANKGMGRPRPILTALSAARDLIDWSGRLIAVACLGIMFAALFTNVVLRYAAGSGIAWAYEIHALLLPWLVAGGLVVAASRGRNIAVTLAADRARGTARVMLTLFIKAAVLVVSVTVLLTSPPILRAAHFQTLSTLGITQFWGYISLIYAFGAMAILATIQIVIAIAAPIDDQRDPSHASLS